MTYPTTPGGVGTDPRVPDQHFDQSDEIDPRWAAPESTDAGVGIGTLLVVGALAIAAILVVLLFFVVRNSDDGTLTTSDAAPASPANSADATDTADGTTAEIEQAETEQDAPEGFITDNGADSEDPAGEDGAGEDGAPSALVVTPDDLGSDDSTTTTTAASTTTTTPASTTTPTTIASTTTVAPATTIAPSTQTTAAPAPAPAPAPGPSGGDAAFQQEVLNLTNAERAAAGCGPVVLDPTLNSVADGHSEDMAANNYFDHTGLNGSQPWDRVQAAGYPAGGSGENIAQGYSTAASVMSGWMTSPGHRRNILNCSWTELGVGYAQGQNGRNNIPPIYWTQVFATRR